MNITAPATTVTWAALVAAEPRLEDLRRRAELHPATWVLYARWKRVLSVLVGHYRTDAGPTWLCGPEAYEIAVGIVLAKWAGRPGEDR